MMPLEYVPLWTLQDAIEHLLDSANATGVSEERRKARRVVIDAYRQFSQMAEWTYFYRHGIIQTQASQSDGTLSYDHSGAAEERLVTLTGDTIDTTYGSWFTVVIDDVHYPVETVVSSTTFTLPEFSNPGADVAAGTSYVLYRNIYPVPVDFRTGGEPIEFEGQGNAPVFVSPEELLSSLEYDNTPQSWLRFYTIRGGGQQYSGLVFEFSPPPSAAMTLTFSYSADPRPIGLIGTGAEYSTGTVSVSGTTVTGVGTTFTSRMIGSVIRFPVSGTTTIPTGAAGAIGNDNPYAEQRIITDVASSVSLTIDQSLEGTHSGAKYTIGDVLDLDYHVMLDAFLALCEWKFANIIKETRPSIEAKEGNWRRMFARAMAADNRTPKDIGEPPPPRYAEVYQ
jgi:hypothetical protein